MSTGKDQSIRLDVRCQISGCRNNAVVQISGHALTKPGWWRVCETHRRVFAAQRPLPARFKGEVS